jgi:hypothetical protein
MTLFIFMIMLLKIGNVLEATSNFKGRQLHSGQNSAIVSAILVKIAPELKMF